MIQGLRTAVYPAPDLARAKAWYTEAFGVAPYFDEPFYVGFNIGGFELGLVPDAPLSKPPGGVVALWGVDDVSATGCMPWALRFMRSLRMSVAGLPSRRC